jgi:tetratricopeptide (TPR) repeat protein/energy-coupling factor transporter ATP-binding protein EcfA2
MVSNFGGGSEIREGETAMTLVTHKYTPAEMSEQELEATFAAREHTVEYLLKSLRDQIHAGTLSSFVVTGPRGAGKSTLLRMVALRVRQDTELRAAWLPVVFPEEQFQVASLRDLLAGILELLVKEGIPGAADWLGKVAAETNDEQSQQLAITGLRELSRAANRRFVVFVENLKTLMEECLTDQMKGTLRRILMIDPFMMLVGSTVHVFDSLKRYDEAFFNYFGEIRLDRLDAGQAIELLTRRARFDGNEQFLREFPSQQPKVRAIVHLSGGNPRLILMLYELLSQRQVVTVVQYLRRLVDELTPLLKDEMENLPPQQRKIVHAIMEKGGTAQPTDLVGPTRLGLNQITSQLKRLKDAQIVEVLGGGKGRAANYTVPDKLFTIWYQMRYLSQNRRRIELFVEVLRIWFEDEDRFVTLQSVAKNARSAAPLAPHDCAMTTEYFASSLKGTSYEREAAELCIGQWAKADLNEAAQAYADFVPESRSGWTTGEAGDYAGLGGWLLDHGDLQHAIGALDAAIAKNPGNTEALAKTLIYRGIAKGKSDDHTGAMADFTAVIELTDAQVNRVALALFNRGVARRQLGNEQGELADYIAVIELTGAPVEPVVRALFNRGSSYLEKNDTDAGVADMMKIVDLEKANANWTPVATIEAFTALHRKGDHSGAEAVLHKVAGFLVSMTGEAARRQVLRILNGLASPEMKAEWPRAFRLLTGNLAQETREALGFFEPVCAILEGGDVSLLNGLPPEQRDLAETVLKRFGPRSGR